MENSLILDKENLDLGGSYLPVVFCVYLQVLEEEHKVFLAVITLKTFGTFF